MANLITFDSATYEIKLNECVNEFHKLADLANTDPQLLTYLNVGIEDSETDKIWNNSKDRLKDYKVNLTRYAERVKEGSGILLKDLLNLRELLEQAPLDKPRSPTIALAAPKRYKIAGKMNAVELRPALIHLQNILDFYDKVLLPYFNNVEKLIIGTPIGNTVEDNLDIDFGLFGPDKWMRGFREVKGDSRFPKGVEVYQGLLTHGDKTLFYMGPLAEATDGVSDWEYLVKNALNFRIKYLSAKPNQEQLSDKTNGIKVSSKSNIQQRLNILIGGAKRINARLDYDRKINDHLSTLEREIDSINSKIRGLEINKEVKSSTAKNRTKISKLSRLLGVSSRLGLSYVSILKDTILLLGALGYVVKQEINEYSKQGITDVSD